MATPVGPSEGAPTTAASVLKQVKDVDGMVNRMPAARGSRGPTDGELSALEEEVNGILSESIVSINIDARMLRGS